MNRSDRPNLVIKLKTLFFTAFWHGIDPSCYIIFFWVTFMIETGSDLIQMYPYIEKKIPNKFIDGLISRILSRYTVVYIFGVFFMGDMLNAYYFMKALYFIPTIGIFAAFVIVKIIKPYVMR